MLPRLVPKTLTLLTTLLVSAVLISGCADQEVSQPENARGNVTDAKFAKGMIAHHRSAIAMAELSATRSRHIEIKELSVAILEQQRTELTNLREIAVQFPRNVSSMMSKEQVASMRLAIEKLRSAADFDRDFIKLMEAHHRDGLTMARREQAEGRNLRLRQISHEIVVGQLADIESLRSWYEDWYGEPLRGSTMDVL